MTPTQLRTEAAGEIASSAASAVSPPSFPATPQVPAKRGRPSRTNAIAAVALALLGVAFCLAASYTPWYREWWMRRATLDSLQKQASTPRGGYDPILLYYLGKRLNEQGRFTEADPILRQGVGLDTDSARLRDEWTRALLGSGLTTAAFGQLQVFAGTHPNSAEAHLILGKFYLTQHSLTRAIEELEKGVALDPKSGEGWANLTAAYSEIQNEVARHDPALAAARKAVALRPNNAGDRLRLAFLLSVPGTPDAARQAFEDAVRLGPNLGEAHRAYANWLIQSGATQADAARAEAEAQKAVSLAPQSGAAYLVLGRAYLGQNEVQNALVPLQKASDLAPFDPNAARTLARAARLLGKLDQAGTWEAEARKRQAHLDAKQATLTEILKDPEKPAPHKKMARLLAQEGEVEGCVRDYARALHLPLDSPPVLAAAANDLSEAGFAEKAMPLAQRAVTVSHASPAAHEALGNALLGVGKAREAAASYDTACVYWPEKFPVYKKRLAAYYEKVRQEKARAPLTPAEQAYQKSRAIIGTQVGPLLVTPEAEALAREAVSLEPKNPVYLRYLLQMQFKVKKIEAIETAKRLLAVAPNDGLTHALLAVLQIDRANTPEALSEARQHLVAAESDPSADATRHYGLGILALHQRDGATAVRELKQAQKLDPNAEMTGYKLFFAYQMVGNKADAARALAESQKRRKVRGAEADALKKLAENADRREAFVEAAHVFDANGHHAEAQIILSAAPSEKK